MRWSNGALNSLSSRDYGANAVLLRCTGAKSGKPRDIPLLAKPLDGGWVLIASAGGQKKNPDWYYNLKSHPHCTLLYPTVARFRILRAKRKASSVTARGKPRPPNTRGTRCTSSERSAAFR